METAGMPGCALLCLPECHHAGFVPTPGASLRLPDTYRWYGSADVVDEWARALK